ncbi:hypothetical protein [Nannocystis pusilla]|uniref:hypothetical protein n=1 Tax=Nannocystis pusilla TaxID=889268 RepID=UPI003B79D1A5
MFALLGPQLARADQFRPPEDKSAVEATITIENLDAYPGYLFVLWPDACLLDSDDLATYTVLNYQDDDGRADYEEYYGGCHTQRLFAFPSDAYAAVDGILAENGLRQLGDDPPSDPRVLVEKIEAEQRWWVPYEVRIDGIEDVYRVAIEGAVLTLTPTRVRFDLGDGHIFDRAFYKGRRPRLPREEDIQRLVPQEPTAPAPASVEAPAEAKVEAKAEPTPAASAEAKAEPSPPPTTETPTSAPPSSPTPAPVSDEPAGEISATPWPPPPLLYGGACLLVAVAAGVALRRRG